MARNDIIYVTSFKFKEIKFDAVFHYLALTSLERAVKIRLILNSHNLPVSLSLVLVLINKQIKLESLK